MPSTSPAVCRSSRESGSKYFRAFYLPDYIRYKAFAFSTLSNTTTSSVSGLVWRHGEANAFFMPYSNRQTTSKQAQQWKQLKLYRLRLNYAGRERRNYRLKQLFTLHRKNSVSLYNLIATLIAWWGVCIDSERITAYGGLVFLVGFTPWAIRETFRDIRQDRLGVGKDW